MLNLLVAALVDAYTSAQIAEGGSLFVTDAQKKWREAFRLQAHARRQSNEQATVSHRG